jgi:hemerythrin-like metal-binding protein
VDYCLGDFTAVPYERDEAHEAVAVASVLNCKLVQFSWYRAFECGNAEIDREHRHLVELANDLLNGIIAGKPAGHLSAIVEQLMQASRSHFEDEEAVLRALGYAHLEQHARLHRSLLNKATKVVAEFTSGKTEIGAVFQFLAEDLIVKHMLGADREFFPLFAQAAPARA